MSLVQNARAIAIELPAHRLAHDTHKQLDGSVLAALRSGGILDALVPEELGGHELSPAAYVELLETLAQGDAATAWCTMTSTSSTMLAAFLPRAVAESIWQPGAFFAGIFAPTGALVAAGDGYRLTGKWSYASGCRHADWFAVGALDGKRHAVCFVPKSSVTIIDNWDTLGLAGTGSHDIAIDVAIRADHVTSIFTGAPWPAGALFRVPIFGLLAIGVAGCALGIARSALDHAASHLGNDTPAPILMRHAELRAKLDAARAYAWATCERAYAKAATSTVDAAARGELRLAASYICEQCTDIARGAFHAVGGAAARANHPVGNALADLETLATHRMVQSRIRPAAARALLGLDGVPPDL